MQAADHEGNHRNCSGCGTVTTPKTVREKKKSKIHEYLLQMISLIAGVVCGGAIMAYSCRREEGSRYGSLASETIVQYIPVHAH